MCTAHILRPRRVSVKSYNTYARNESSLSQYYGISTQCIKLQLLTRWGVAYKARNNVTSQNTLRLRNSGIMEFCNRSCLENSLVKYHLTWVFIAYRFNENQIISLYQKSRYEHIGIFL